MKKIGFIIVAIIGTFILSIIGLLIGMNLFGNFFVDVTFLGARGYEAGGNIGAIFGLVIGTIISIVLYRRVLFPSGNAINKEE